jgi:protein transport protein SEC23
MEFAELEARDGIRFSFNVWPSSRFEAARVAVPLSCIWTPAKRINGLLELPYEPVLCKHCAAVLNPYVRVDFVTKTWTCPFCHKRTTFPPHYSQIAEHALPGELIPTSTTVEYKLPQARTLMPSVVVFVVDIVNIESEIQALSASLINTITLIPENVRIGLVMYGRDVFLYELGGSEIIKSHMIKGDTAVTTQELQELLFSPASGGPGVCHTRAQMLDSLFLVARDHCEFVLSEILEDMQASNWPVALGERQHRCTGAAIAAATSLLELGAPTVGSRIVLCTGGECTHGPGLVASMKQEEKLRSHSDLAKGLAPYTAAAEQFYQLLGTRMNKANIVCDVFAMALDQLGLLEMRFLTEMTGGHLVNHESFKGGVQGEVFSDSLMKMFEVDENGLLPMCYNASIEVRTANEFKVCGAIGPLVSKNEAHSCVSEIETGIGGTRAWRMAGIDATTACSVYFEVTNAANIPAQGSAMQLQLLCHYIDSAGNSRLRVTTIARKWAGSNEIAQVGASFDQEAAAVLTARLVSWRAQHEPVFDVMRWLDRMLIRLCAKFGQYKKDDPASFTLPANISIFPQFMFHLRRSQFLQVFNSSPDETSYYRYHLNKQSIPNCLVMIQPTLISYSLSAPPTPVLLDNSQILPDRVLMLDAFFWLTIWTGETIAAWRNAGYHEQPEYENVKQLLDAPKADMKELVQGRIPVSRLIETDQHKSQSRFLLAKLNPSITHMSQQAGYGGASASTEVVFTDDVSLQVFVQHLGKLAVQGQ